MVAGLKLGFIIMDLPERILISLLGLLAVVLGTILYVYLTGSDMNVITNVQSANNATFSITLQPES